MPEGETELEMVTRHVAERAEHVRKQKALIACLRQTDRPTQEAEAVLDSFEVSQRQHEDHLARILARPGLNGLRGTGSA